MQIRISQNVQVMIFIAAFVLMVGSIYVVLKMKSGSEAKVIHCASTIDSYVNKSSLHATVTLYLYRGKGSVQISGDYSPSEGTHIPVKSVTSLSYHPEGQDYHIRFTLNKTSFRGETATEDIGHLIPLSLTSNNVDYIYHFEEQGEGSYLIRQNGIPLIMCKKI